MFIMIRDYSRTFKYSKLFNFLQPREEVFVIPVFLKRKLRHSFSELLKVRLVRTDYRS